MTTDKPHDHHATGDVRAELEAAERKVASDIDPGARAMFVAIAVLILLATFSLPHAGSANGWEVLAVVGASGQVAGPDNSLHAQPANAIAKALEKQGITASDLDHVEIRCGQPYVHTLATFFHARARRRAG